MGIAEIASRGRQELLKRLDRTLLDREAGGDRDRGSGWGRREALLEEAAQRFFAGVADRRSAGLLASRMPDAIVATIDAADSVLEGRFDLLGYRGLSFGRPIDWHLDPTTGRRSPLLHWSRLDALDPSLVGDSKVVWELNRHQWMVTLGQAYWSSGDERYAEAFAARLDDWIRSNARGFGINWASSLEVALRLVSWCWALLLMRGASALTAERLAQAHAALQHHASHVERYLSRYFSPNTHLTGEALGLFYAGTVLGELESAQRWRCVGTQILIEHGERQIHEDGVYFEQATCYQRYTAEIYLHFLVLRSRSGLHAPPGLPERVQGLLDFLLRVRRPDGGVPQIGDADGGCLLPLVRRDPGDLRGVFAVAAAFFGRPDYAWAARGPAPELLWLLGPQGLQAFDALSPAPPQGAASRAFGAGGYVVMRDGWECDGHQLILDVGPLGCAVSSAHGHADLLSVQCSAHGEAFLVDPGTFTYTPERQWRHFFRSTAAHSTVLVDGEGQAQAAGVFSWRSRPAARLHQWRSTEAFDFADASHDAYRRLADPVSHRRRVLFVKPRYFVVVDDLEGAAEHDVEVRFQFAPLEISADGDLGFRAHGPRGAGLLLRSFAGVPLRAGVLQGSEDPIAGWVSPDYGRRQSAPMVVCKARARLPLRIVTLLLPLRDSGDPSPLVSVIEDERGVPVGLNLDGRESLLFGEEGPFTLCAG
jgi:hypothetical protein